MLIVMYLGASSPNTRCGTCYWHVMDVIPSLKTGVISPMIGLFKAGLSKPIATGYRGVSFAKVYKYRIVRVEKWWAERAHRVIR